MAKVSNQMIERVRGHLQSNAEMALTAHQVREDLDISYSSTNQALNALAESGEIEIDDSEAPYEYRWVGEPEGGDVIQALKDQMCAIIDEAVELGERRGQVMGRQLAAQDVSDALKNFKLRFGKLSFDNQQPRA